VSKTKTVNMQTDWKAHTLSRRADRQQSDWQVSHA